MPLLEIHSVHLGHRSWPMLALHHFLRNQTEPSLLFYADRLRGISERDLPLREIEEKTLEALRHVERNPSAIMILQEIAFLFP